MTGLTTQQQDEVARLISEKLSPLTKEQRAEIEEIAKKIVQTSELSPAQKWDSVMLLAKVGAGIIALLVTTLSVAGYLVIKSEAETAANKLTANTAADALSTKADFIQKVQGGVFHVVTCAKDIPPP